MKLKTRAFFFNAKTDYLPYYKPFTVNVDENKSVVEILKSIQAQNPDFAFPQERIVFRINDLVVSQNTTVAQVVERLGSELTIEPVSTYRAVNGLIINDDDFMESFFLLEPFGASKERFEALYDLHYASETSNYKRNYIGDALLVLASELIEEHPDHTEEILSVLTKADSGLLDCEYENNLFEAQEHRETIEALKEMTKPEVGPSPLTLIKSLFTEVKPKEKIPTTKERKTKMIGTLQQKNVAYYHANSTLNNTLLETLKSDHTTLIPFEKAHKRSGRTLLAHNKELAFQKAARIALSALDSGAEVMLIENLDAYNYFHDHKRAIEKMAGRDINLEYIYAQDYLTSHLSIAHS